MPPLERYEPCSPAPCDRLGTGSAPFRKQFGEAFRAIRLIVAGGKLLPGQHSVAVGAGEALAVPRFVFEGDAARGHDFLALGAPRRELVLETLDAVDVVFVGDDEGLRADELLADRALETRVVPFPTFVLHHFHARFEKVATDVTPRGEFRVVTKAAKYVSVFVSERLRDQGCGAAMTIEAVLEIDYESRIAEEKSRPSIKVSKCS